jgi:PAS domain S-box-containing protein
VNSATAPILAALVLQLGLGIAVFESNPKRKSNQAFLLVSVAIAGWLSTLFFGLTTNNLGVVETSIRSASAAGALLLTLVNVLRVSIRRSDENWPSILRRCWGWIVTAALIGAFCFTEFFLKSVSRGQGAAHSSPIPNYGSGYYVYAIYFAAAVGLLIIGCIRDLRQTTGGRHAEMAFVTVGAIAALLSSVPLAVVLSLFFDTSNLVWTAPFRIMLFSMVVAYGVATRKIMEVGLFFRRVMSYFVLTAYLIALYSFVCWLSLKALRPFLANAETIAYLMAALVIAFAMAPARGLSQALADKLFVGTRRLDFRGTVSKAAAILESVTTLPDLLERFAATIGEAVGTDSVTIYLVQRREFRRMHPRLEEETSTPVLSATEPLVEWLEARREPLILDELYRIRETPATLAIRDRLEELKAAAALGIHSREHLAGIMLLGPRLSGRIYGNTEQSALQVLCGQLAVAVENAELFTEVQNARIYNETLLQNMTTGVIAADADGRITVFNQEAEQITSLSASDALERSIDALPAPLRTILKSTLTSGEPLEDREVNLRASSGNVFARASSSIFHGQDGQLLGALMVVTDITALKRLELQIRRSDRLASLGTLSAGMAHEIKNPLVSIKTFAQLLPERYNESDFRDTFSSLIVHEIDRIDALVNQLLRFARPAKPVLRPMHVHEVLEKTLSLVQHRLYQKEIKLTRSWDAGVDTIRADADQLEQVFLNFFLNAMDAMKRGGELTVMTEIRSGDGIIPQLSANGSEGDEALRISIRDTGEGIRSEDIPHVFDPFFTTKDFGTGLGLSVVHGIIQEHGGQIEVESELAKGTAFHIFLPLVRFSEEVAAA